MPSKACHLLAMCVCAHTEVNLSNFDEQRQQRNHHGDVAAGCGRRSQEGSEAGGASKVGSRTQTHKAPPL